MPRYIWISFLFLAWVFYEVSGGADFTPGSEEQLQVAEAATDTRSSSLIAAASAETAPARERRNVDIIRLITQYNRAVSATGMISLLQPTPEVFDHFGASIESTGGNGPCRSPA